MNRSEVEETIAIDGTPGTAELQLGILHRCFRAAKILNPNPTLPIQCRRKAVGGADAELELGGPRIGNCIPWRPNTAGGFAGARALLGQPEPFIV
jgi:hypothetical protein